LGRTAKPAAWLDDGQFSIAGFGKVGLADGALVSPIGEDDLDERKGCAHFRVENQGGSITVLNADVMSRNIQQQPKRIDGNVVLDALDLFPRVIADRVRVGPPFCAARTL